MISVTIPIWDNYGSIKAAINSWLEDNSEGRYEVNDTRKLIEIMALNNESFEVMLTTGFKVDFEYETDAVYFRLAF